MIKEARELLASKKNANLKINENEADLAKRLNSTFKKKALGVEKTPLLQKQQKSEVETSKLSLSESADDTPKNNGKPPRLGLRDAVQIRSTDNI